jgi:hypothetical protein
MFLELLSRDREDGSGTEPDECGMRISDCGFKNKIRGDVIDEWLCVSSMKMFDSINYRNAFDTSFQ